MTVLIAAALVLGILWLLRNLLRGDKKSLRQQWKIYGMLAMAVFLLLAVTKKLHVLSLLAAGLIPIVRQLAPLALRFAPFLHQQFQRYRFQKPHTKSSHEQDHGHGHGHGHHPDADAPNANGQASVNTALFHMRLDHQTGKISGSVRKSRYLTPKLDHLADLLLDNLDTETLGQLYVAAQACPDDSLAVYEAYLQSRFGQTWQESVLKSQADPHNEHTHQQASQSSNLTIDEAWAILGLSPGAPKDQVISRHKSLIQKLHPDRGGSNYLTVRINQARDLLLKKIA